MRFFSRVGPALVLIPLAPLIAEFLLGDFSVRMLALVLVLAPMYGGGALLIREVTRRSGRGWPTMVLLATAYALIEEAYTTQSLFNPDYAGARLLDYGFIPALGTSLNWSLFVLSIHVVWSVATPILIVEGLAAERRTTPWLKTPGSIITVLLFLLGCAATTNYSLHASPFRASLAQLVSAGVLVLITVIAAFVIAPSASRAGTTVATPAPAAWLVILATFILAIAFIAIESVLGRGHGLPAPITLAADALCEVVAAVLILRWSQSRDWNATHYLAIATGTSLAYASFGLYAFAIEGHTHLRQPTGTIDIAGEIAIALIVILLIAWGMRRNQRLQRTDLRGALV